MELHLNQDPLGPNDSIHDPEVYHKEGEVIPETDEDRAPTVMNNEGEETDRN